MSSAAEILKDVKALTFDVFGAVVDWRTSINAELIETARNKVASPAFAGLSEPLRSRFQGISDADWGTFAQQWRTAYGEFTWTFIPGEFEWKDIDEEFYDSLKELLREWDVEGVYVEEEIRSLSLAWHRLKPWSDSAQGIQMLGTRYITSTLSNGSRSLLEDLNKLGSLGFQHIISTGDFEVYKPHPSAYLDAAKTLNCQPNEVAMVAAHLGDLRAARHFGMRTIYVERTQEKTWTDREIYWDDAREWVDLRIPQGEGGLVELARQLGISSTEA